MQEHIGKKRRKEIRMAINLKKECNKRLLRSSICIAVVIVVMLVFTILSFKGIIGFNSMMTQTALFAFAIIILFVVGFDANKFWEARARYKDTIKRYNITKEDMAQLKAME